MDGGLRKHVLNTFLVILRDQNVAEIHPFQILEIAEAFRKVIQVVAP